MRIRAEKNNNNNNNAYSQRGENALRARLSIKASVMYANLIWERFLICSRRQTFSPRHSRRMWIYIVAVWNSTEKATCIIKKSQFLVWRHFEFADAWSSHSRRVNFHSVWHKLDVFAQSSKHLQGGGDYIFIFVCFWENAQGIIRDLS